MTEKELLLQLLTKFYNKTEAEAVELIYSGDALSDSAFDNVSTVDAARVAKFNREKSDAFKNGEAKAVERVNKTAAKTIIEKLGIETDSDILDEVLETAATQIEEKISKKVQPMTDEAVKQHPLYIKLEKERVPKADHEKVVNEFTQFKTSIENEKVFSVVDEQAMQHLAKMNPNRDMYKDSPAVLANIEKMFKNSLKEYEYKSDGNGGFIVLKNGERVNDEHGNPKSIETIVKENAPNYFTFLKQPAKGSAGNEEKGGSGGGASASPDFKTVSEYTEYMQSLGDTAEDGKKKVEAFNKYKEGVKAGTIK
jgi:hypothetical protein